MHDHKFGFPLALQDPTTNQAVNISFFGSVDVLGSTDEPRLHAALHDGITRVLGSKLAAQQVAMPTLSSSLPYFLPEIISASLPSLGGASITRLELSANVPQSAVQPAAAAIAAAPTPMESVANSFSRGVEQSIERRIPNRVNVRVGGFKIGVGADGKVNESGLIGQVKDKIVDNLITIAVVGGVVLLLGCITMGVLAKILLM